jgi:curved DNA-binding protein CbpA
MQELNAAWEVLGDPHARADYDRQRPRTDRQPWDDEDARVQADIRRRMAEPFDPVATFLRVLPVLVVLFLLFVVFLFTAYAGGGDDAEGGGPTTAPAASAPDSVD